MLKAGNAYLELFQYESPEPRPADRRPQSGVARLHPLLCRRRRHRRRVRASVGERHDVPRSPADHRRDGTRPTPGDLRPRPRRQHRRAAGGPRPRPSRSGSTTPISSTSRRLHHDRGRHTRHRRSGRCPMSRTEHPGSDPRRLDATPGALLEESYAFAGDDDVAVRGVHLAGVRRRRARPHVVAHLAVGMPRRAHPRAGRLLRLRHRRSIRRDRARARRHASRRSTTPACTAAPSSSRRRRSATARSCAARSTGGPGRSTAN